MKSSIVQFPFGLVAFGEQGQVVEKALFPKRAQAAAKIISKLESGKLTSDIENLVSSLQTLGYDTLFFENAQLAEQTKTQLGIQTEVATPKQAEAIRANSQNLAVAVGFVKDAQELALWTRNVTMELAKLQVKGETEKRDLIVAQAIQTLDDLDRTLNLFMGRLREWYGVHFPELDRLVEKHETYARLVLDLGSKENFTAVALQKEDLPKNKVEQISRIAESSMGADTAEVDLNQIQALSKNVFDMYKLRENMEAYLDNTMDEIAPNIKAIVGSLLGARLISIAGGLQNLARRPASTMQVLGAEKALFRSLKTGARPPKHGLIFQHTLIHDAKRWQRGKIARAVAGKLSIAARIDAFGGQYAGKKLKADLNRRIEEIHQKYPEPPPVQEQKPAEQRPREQRRDFKDRKSFRGGGDKRRNFRRGGDGGRDRKWRKNKRANKS
ncbi:MAG: C/D box methylation guide ribonucleoprotein complex aNOP56 subunit [Candidatus Bathyarchaeota archaeon]|nr:C/D box methylation guide ribonucleoprotein complex aNOP56 subunit [Candidatus Bathyarchaeota archaeon]